MQRMKNVAKESNNKNKLKSKKATFPVKKSTGSRLAVQLLKIAELVAKKNQLKPTTFYD